MKNFWAKFKLFWRELGNILTNVLCPIVSLVIAIMEILHLPISAISFMKKVEYWLFFASGTKEKIDEIIEDVDKKTEE